MASATATETIVKPAHRGAAPNHCIGNARRDPSLAGDMPVNADGLTWGPVPPVLPKGAPGSRRPIRGPLQRRTLCIAAEDAREL